MQVIFNGKPQSVGDEATVLQILEEFEVDRRQVAVEVNLELVPRAELDKRVLHDGDRIEVVTLVGGG